MVVVLAQYGLSSYCTQCVYVGDISIHADQTTPIVANHP